MGAGYVNEETPETKALVRAVKVYLLNCFPESQFGDDEFEDMARAVVKDCGMYREHRVEL